jgi:DNA-binding transcriptional MerR regulator
MRIGELARRAGASARSLRYYEEQGLLRSDRDANGWRDYDEAEVRFVLEIRSLLAGGFGLDEIRPLLDCLRSGTSVRLACPDAAAVYGRKLAELDAAIADLSVLRDQVAADLTAIEGLRAEGARATSEESRAC